MADNLSLTVQLEHCKTSRNIDSLNNLTTKIKQGKKVLVLSNINSNKRLHGKLFQVHGRKHTHDL